MENDVKVKKTVQRYALLSVDQLDTLLDRLPTAEFSRGEKGSGTANIKLYRYGQWGCRLGLAKWVAVKDEQLDLGIYKPTVPVVTIDAELAARIELVKQRFAEEMARSDGAKRPRRVV